MTISNTGTLMVFYEDKQILLDWNGGAGYFVDMTKFIKENSDIENLDRCLKKMSDDNIHADLRRLDSGEIACNLKKMCEDMNATFN